MFNLNIHDSLLVLSSIFITTAIFNGALYFGYHRRLSYLFFVCYCIFHVFKIWLKSFPPNEVLIDLFVQFTAYDLIYLSVVAGVFSLIVYLAYDLKIRNRKSLSLIIGIGSVMFYLFLPENLFIIAGITWALGQSLYAYEKGNGHLLLIGALLSLLIFTILGILDIIAFGYFLGTLILVFLMVIRTGINLSHQTTAFHQANLRSARLENQLLKKNIQPHFILNSLTSLQELIEVSPEKASQFVEDMAHEFKLFARVSDQKLISIKDELMMVKKYLNILSIRLDKTFETKLENIDPEALIPPGIILTLVENGVTHGFASKKIGEFSIEKQEKETTISYIIKNNGSSNTPIKEGVGLQYVRSRLEESFGNNFSLQLSPLTNGFQTVIEIPK